MKYFAKTKPDDVFAGIKYNDKIAKGEIESIITDPILEKDIDECKQAKQKADEAAKTAYKKETPDYDTKIQMAILTAAAYRDIRYSLMGRKYLRIGALVGSNVGLFHRVQGLVRIASYREQDVEVNPDNKPQDYTG